MRYIVPSVFFAYPFHENVLIIRHKKIRQQFKKKNVLTKYYLFWSYSIQTENTYSTRQQGTFVAETELHFCVKEHIHNVEQLTFFFGGKPYSPKTKDKIKANIRI